MEYIKMQLACLVILGYVAYDYYRESRKVERTKESRHFRYLLGIAIVTMCLDTLTAYMVNHLDMVSDFTNRLFHMFFLIGMDTFIFATFQYMLFITEGIPNSKRKRRLIGFPYIVSVVIVVTNMNSLEFRTGVTSNYSMGISAYTCFGMVGFYALCAIIVFLHRWTYIEKSKRASITVYLSIMVVVTIYQMLAPEALLTALANLVIILYLEIKN